MDREPIHHARVVSTGLLICISILFGVVIGSINYAAIKMAGLIQEDAR